MRPNLNVWKMISIALAATLLVMLLSSRVEPTRADSQNSHFMLVQGVAPLGLGPNPASLITTMFRVDTVTGEVVMLNRNATNYNYQWFKVREPQ